MKSDSSDSGDNNGKNDNNNELGIHSVQNRDAPTPPSEANAHAHDHYPIQTLPHGLQFLNRQSQERRFQNVPSHLSHQSNGLTLDLNTLLGDSIETTTPPSQSDTFMSTQSSLDLGFLLGGLGGGLGAPGGAVHSHSDSSHSHGHHGLGHHGNVHHDHAHDHHAQSHGHEHGHGEASHVHNSIHDKANLARSSGGHDKHLLGMFGQHLLQPGHAHQEVITPASTNTAPSNLFYQNSTEHGRPITKRGVIDNDSVSGFQRNFIDNMLNIRIRKTTPPPAVVPTTQPTRYGGYLTTSRSAEIQIERLSGIDLNRVRETNRKYVRGKGTADKTANNNAAAISNIAAPSPKELVHLQGIHIMFSDGKQDSTGKVPTVHLTAAVSDNLNHLLQVANGSPQTPSVSSNVNDITDRITGTAVIRDGHLYLVVYPFGKDKSLEVHYNQTTKRIPLPRNNPVSYSGATKSSTRPKFSSPSSQSIKPTASSKIVPPGGQTRSVEPTAQSSMTSTSFSDHHASVNQDTPSATHAHHHPPKHEVGAHQHAHDHHHDHHHQHGSSTPSLTGLKLSEVNDTTLQTLLAPIDRFVSPWKSLNFSKVFPYSAGINNNTTAKKVLDEDSEVDVVTFVAKATDPFNRMKVIIDSLVNKTLLNASSTSNQENGTETRFNFELKLEPGSKQTVNENKQPTNSEEKIFDMNSTISKIYEQVTETMLPTTVNSFVKAAQENSATTGKSSGESVTPVNLDQLASETFTTTTVSVAGGDTKTATDSIATKYSGSVVENTNSMGSNNRNLLDRKHVSGSDNVKVSPKFDSLLHASGNVASTNADRRPKGSYGSKTTLSYIPNYTKSSYVRQPTYQITTPVLKNIFPSNHNSIQRNKPVTPRNTILGSNLQPFVQRTSPNRFRQGLSRGQSEQIISLSDILNDIRRIQLHNMQRFNIQNNNFDTMILSETRQKPVVRKPIVMEGPVIRGSGKRRYSDFPAELNNNNNSQKRSENKFASVTPITEGVTQRRVNRDASYDNGLEAMLVLSVDDIMSDQPDFHGAIVMSHKRAASSSNAK